jgi:prepilin-type processing-associated H-X9-DG protein
MPIAQRAGRFFGPWLAFAALSGLGVAFVCGITATLIGFVAGLAGFLGALGDGNFLPGAKEVIQSFPAFAKTVILVVASTFVGGFLPGFLTALLGQNRASWIGFLAGFFGLSFLYPQFFYILLLALFGAMLPLALLAHDKAMYSWDGPLRHWLRGTWLINPPPLARGAGVLAPLILGGTTDILTVYPEYTRHSHYVQRIGQWNTWWNSRRIAKMSSYMGRLSCQSNLKQIMLGVSQYVQDYDEVYPPYPTNPGEGMGAILQPYLRSTQLFQCPNELFNYADGDFRSGDFTDYWVNARFYGLPVTATSNASSSVTMGDGNMGHGEATSAYSLRSLPPIFPPLNRHNGRGNYAFADGHVKWYRPRIVSNMALSSAGGPTMIP